MNEHWMVLEAALISCSFIETFQPFNDHFAGKSWLTSTRQYFIDLCVFLLPMKWRWPPSDQVGPCNRYGNLIPEWRKKKLIQFFLSFSHSSHILVETRNLMAISLTGHSSGIGADEIIFVSCCQPINWAAGVHLEIFKELVINRSKTRGISFSLEPSTVAARVRVSLYPTGI